MVLGPNLGAEDRGSRIKGDLVLALLKLPAW